MITPVEGGIPPTGHVRQQLDSERILQQIERREVKAGPEAARAIARRIEEQGGFWGPRKTAA